MEARKVLELLNGPTGFAGEIELTTVEEMVRRGQGDVRLCIVLSGMVRLTAYTEDGREMLTHIIMPGDCWGVHPCLGGYSETNDAIVEEGGLIVIVRPEIVSDLMWTRQDFQKAMVGLLCQRTNIVLKAMEKDGRLALKYGTIRILDLNALRAETRRTS